MKKINREAWLRSAYKVLRKAMVKEAPEEVAIGWGFPSKKAISTNARRIGECWHGGFGQKPEGGIVILVSPTIRKPLDILSTLLHEMVHAATPGSGHRKEFSQLAKRMGFQKPWKQTPLGPELKKKLVEILSKLPTWPKGTLHPVAKQKGRQKKLICPCARVLRGALATIKKGPIVCGLCKKDFKLV